MFIRLSLIVFFVFASQVLPGQDSVRERLVQAEKLSEEGAFEKAALIFKEIADYWKEQKQPDSIFFYQYREASQYSNAYQFERAARQLDELIPKIEIQNRRPDFLGRVYYRAGSNYVYLNEFEKALQLLDQCLVFEKARPVPDTLYIAKATEWKGLSYSYLGNLDKARDLIEEALDVRMDVLLEDASEIGYNYNSLGLVYMELNALEKADTAFSEAFRILSKHLPPNHAHLSSIRSNISTIKSTQGDFHIAKSLLEESIAAHLSEQRLYPLMDDYFNLGALFLSLDDSEHALPYINKALTLADSILPYPHFTRTNIRDGLAGICYSEAKFEQADSIFRQSLNEKKLLFEPTHPEIGRTYYALGLIAKETGQAEDAKDYYTRSFSIRRQALGEDHPATADALYGLAELDWLEDKRELALQNFRVCLGIYEQNLGKVNQSFIQTALRMAEFFEKMEELDSVEVYLRKSWSGVLGENITDEDWDDLDKLEIQFVDSYTLNLIEFHLRFLNRKAFFSEEDLLNGRQILVLMDQLLNKMLPLVEFENTNRNQVFGIQQIYRQGALLIKKGLGPNKNSGELQDLLLYCLAQSRAITIRSAVQNREALQFANVPEEVVEKDRRLREQMRFLKARSTEAENVAQRYFESLEQWRNYQQELQSSYPEWFKLRYDRSFPQQSQITQQLGKEHTSLLVYFDLDTSLLALTLNEHSFKNYLLPVPTSWPDSVETYQKLIARQASPSRLASLGHYLYQILWAPLQDDLKETVSIVPDGALFYLNFETLLSDFPQNTDYQLWPWLIRDHTIFYRNQLPQVLEKRNRGVDNILAIAPAFTREVKNEYLQNLPIGQAPDSLFLSWLRTPWSVEFAQQIGREGTALIAEQAGKQAFLELAPEAGILHLGTHAVIQDVDPLLSYFALYPQATAPDDGYLYAYELYNLPLKAQLSVLTACQTGLGQYQKGEGVLSLAHAFQYAGCPSVVYSLWSIDDQQSNRLMEDFYFNMKEGASFAQALRQAKLTYLEQHSGELSSPYYWGGMVLIGESSSLEPSSSFLSKYWWSALGLMALGLFVWLFFRKK